MRAVGEQVLVVEVDRRQGVEQRQERPLAAVEQGHLLGPPTGPGLDELHPAVAAVVQHGREAQLGDRRRVGRGGRPALPADPFE